MFPFIIVFLLLFMAMDRYDVENANIFSKALKKTLNFCSEIFSNLESL